MSERDMSEADAVARSRPPDRVSYTPWEPIYGKPQKELVATDVRGVFFQTVHKFTEIEREPVVGYRRRRQEYWEEPRRVHPVFARYGGEMTVTTEVIRPRTVGRWVWEYGPSPASPRR